MTLRRTDLDGFVDVNPDEAGLVDLVIDNQATPGQRQEVDLLVESAIDPQADVEDLDYWLRDGVYGVTVIGYPVDSYVLSQWDIIIKVKS